MIHKDDAMILEYARTQDRGVLADMMGDAADPERCSQNENQLARHLSYYLTAYDILIDRLESISRAAANHEYADCYFIAENALGREPDTSMGV